MRCPNFATIPASTLVACSTRVRSAAVVSVGETQPGSMSTARHTARIWSSPISAGLNGFRQRRQLRRKRRAGQRTARPDPNRELEPSADFVGRDAQSLPQHRSHLRYRPGLIRRVGDLGENAVHQAAVGALLGLQSRCGINAKPVAHQIRRRIAHHVVGGVDRIESGSDPFSCFVGADRWTHTSKLRISPTILASADGAKPNLWIKSQLWISSQSQIFFDQQRVARR